MKWRDGFLKEAGATVNLLTEAWRWRETASEAGQEITGAECAKALLKQAGLPEVGDAALSRLALPADPPGNKWWERGRTASRQR